MGILGNEKVDKKTKETTLYPLIPVRLLSTKSDLTRYARNIITTHWARVLKNPKRYKPTC